MLAACSTVSSPSTHEGRPDAIIQIDARPGEFQLLRGSLDAESGALPEPIRFVIEVKKLQPSGKWGPTLNLCVYVGAETQVNCLQVIKDPKIEHLVPLTQLKVGADSDVQAGGVNYYLAQNAKHTVDITFANGQVSFSIDGRLASAQPARLVPESYYVSCSSMICDVAVYQPPGRP
jgi:hypothetical protein